MNNPPLFGLVLIIAMCLAVLLCEGCDAYQRWQDRQRKNEKETT
jgi:hypothetical protein